MNSCAWICAISKWPCSCFNISSSSPSILSGWNHDSILDVDATTSSLVILYSHGVLLDLSHQTVQSMLVKILAPVSSADSVEKSSSSGKVPITPWKSSQTNGLFLSQITNSFSLQVSL